ncbi:MAG: hypothetical protein QOF58_538 [Pseudonocardiales bacterium]|nr:hypothetical protein [Pseudonocardiales bacterium]
MSDLHPLTAAQQLRALRAKEVGLPLGIKDLAATAGSVSLPLHVDDDGLPHPPCWYR